MTRDLNDVIRDLSQSDRNAPSDDHFRWALYLGAAEEQNRWQLLLEAAHLEPDPSMALSLVLRMLEKVPADCRASWTSSLSVRENKEYASRRAAELEIFESILAGDFEIKEMEDVPHDWSDWLQLKLAELCDGEAVLEHLSEHGRTKRIRRLAAERLVRIRFQVGRP